MLLVPSPREIAQIMPMQGHKYLNSLTTLQHSTNYLYIYLFIQLSNYRKDKTPQGAHAKLCTCVTCWNDINRTRADWLRILGTPQSSGGTRCIEVWTDIFLWNRHLKYLIVWKTHKKYSFKTLVLKRQTFFLTPIYSNHDKIRCKCFEINIDFYIYSPNFNSIENICDLSMILLELQKNELYLILILQMLIEKLVYRAGLHQYIFKQMFKVVTKCTSGRVVKAFY